MIVAMIIPALLFERLSEVRQRTSPLLRLAISRPNRGRRTNQPQVSGLQPRRRLAEAEQREMIERRHRPPLDKVDVGSVRHPIGEALPREIEAPAEPVGNRSKRFLDLASQASLGPNAIGQDDLSTWLNHASEFVERRFWVRTGRYHIG